jgi:starvation-inducible DNA-binding protein
MLSLNSADISKSIQVLNELLANTYALYLKTQNAHWNVQGESFHMLHVLFESEYQSLQNAIDDIAERIKILGGVIEASFEKFHEKSGVTENLSDYRGINVLNTLAKDHDCVIFLIRRLLKKLEQSLDDGTKDLLVSRLKDHEKTYWFLNSHLKG